MKRRFVALAILVVLVLLPQVASADGPQDARVLVGLAGWYGTGWNECLGCRWDRIMANGERLNDEEMTIACGYQGSCEFFPVGTTVRITNLENGKSVKARVTDTGNFTELNRIADCSKAVAEALSFDSLARVKIEVDSVVKSPSLSLIGGERQ